MYGPVTISQQTVRRLVVVQSALSALQMVAAASVLGDFMQDRYAALFIVVVAAAQQGVNTFISKSVGEAVSHADSVITRAEQVTADAHSTVTDIAAVMPPSNRAAVALLEREADKPHG